MCNNTCALLVREKKYKQGKYMFEILMYLFENYIHTQDNMSSDSEMLCDELELAGFNKSEIQKAFLWFADLADHGETIKYVDNFSTNSFRVFTLEEKKKLGRRCIGFIMFMEQASILSPELREILIERCMAVESARIDLEQLKWITLMVLFHCHDQNQIEPDLTWIENIVFADIGNEIIQ